MINCWPDANRHLHLHHCDGFAPITPFTGALCQPICATLTRCRLNKMQSTPLYTAIFLLALRSTRAEWTEYIHNEAACPIHSVSSLVNLFVYSASPAQTRRFSNNTSTTRPSFTSLWHSVIKFRLQLRATNFGGPSICTARCGLPCQIERTPWNP